MSIEYKCAWCLNVIPTDQRARMHIHHDPTRCIWKSPTELIQGVITVPVMEKIRNEHLGHDLFCHVRLYYHENCCQWCSEKMQFT